MCHHNRIMLNYTLSEMGKRIIGESSPRAGALISFSSGPVPEDELELGVDGGRGRRGRRGVPDHDVRDLYWRLSVCGLDQYRLLLLLSSLIGTVVLVNEKSLANGGLLLDLGSHQCVDGGLQKGKDSQNIKGTRN